MNITMNRMKYIEKLWMNCQIKELNSDFKELDEVKNELKKEKD